MDNNDLNGFDISNLTDEEIAMFRRMEQKSREREIIKQQEKKRREANAARLVKARRTATVAVILIALASLAVAAVCYVGNLTLSQVFSSVTSAVGSLGGGGGYPYDVSSGKVTDMRSIDNKLAVLTSEKLVLLSQSAKPSFSVSHTYASPKMKIENGRLLLCDTVTGRYILCSHNAVIKQGDINSRIHCFAVGTGGLLAFAIPADGVSSKLGVYNEHGKKLFDFNCADEYIISAAFSLNGRYLAAAAIGSENAVLYSKIYIFDVKKFEQIEELTYKDTSVMEISRAANNFIAVCEDECILISDKKASRIKIKGGTISHFAGSSGGTFAVAVSRYGSHDEADIKVFSSGGREKFTCEIPSNIELMDYDGTIVSVFCGNDTLYSFSSSGKQIGILDLDTQAQRLAVESRHCYALCYDRIRRLSTHKRQSEQANAINAKNKTEPATTAATEESSASIPVTEEESTSGGEAA